MGFNNSKVFGKEWVPSPKKRQGGFKLSGQAKKDKHIVTQKHLKNALKHLKFLCAYDGDLAPGSRYWFVGQGHIYFNGGYFHQLFTDNNHLSLEGNYMATLQNEMNTEMGTLILLISLVNRLGGVIAVPVEATDEAYADCLYVAQDVSQRDYIISTKTGSLNGQKALRISHEVSLKGNLEIDVETAIKAMLLQNGVGPKTLARVERKYFEQATLMNLKIDPDQDFDDYVYISLEKKKDAS